MGTNSYCRVFRIRDPSWDVIGHSGYFEEVYNLFSLHYRLKFDKIRSQNLEDVNSREATECPQIK